MKDKNKDKIRVSVWLTEAENEKLKLSAKLCGLSQSEFVRQLCKGKIPKPQPAIEFWKLLEELYYVHNSFKACAKYEPSVLISLRIFLKGAISLSPSSLSIPSFTAINRTL